MKASKLLILGALTLSQTLGAAEVDQFTRRGEPLSDSSALINTKANASIQQSIKAVNAKNKGCNEDALYDELQVYFNNHVRGKLIKDILKDNNIEKRVVSQKESVYQDWGALDGIGMGFKVLAKTGLTMTGVIKVGEQEIGTDKLEHMFGQGFAYFEKNYLKGKGEVKAIKRGIFGEKFLLGGNIIGNGVFSYGDLGANFNGMRLWNHMLQKHDDVLGADHNLGPYIACKNDKWEQVKEIDFKDYIDDSMDEAINCAKFPSERTVAKFKERLKLKGTSCPVDQRRLDDVHAKYGEMAKWIINLDGPGAVKYFGEFKDK